MRIGLFFAFLLPLAAETTLESEMARLAVTAGATVGASAIHIETGRRVSLRGNERFPMASTYKVPIAVELLRRVDTGEERLDRMITLEREDYSPGSGALSDLFRNPGVALSVRNLLELMLLISDNTATDVLLREVKGGPAVTARMRALGIEGIDVQRPTKGLIADFRKSYKAFQTDIQDTSTPEAMASLLVMIYEKRLHKPENAELLLDIMRRCRTGDARLKGILPEGTVVAHKTGSMGRASQRATNTNDVGIITLPNGAGHVAIAVFVKNGDGPAAQQERAIAEIARAVHDYFLLFGGGALDYDKMASRILDSLKLEKGERVKIGGQPNVFTPLRARLRAKLGAAETESLDEATSYLWLPVKGEIPAAERAALAAWLARGGPRRMIHFHWQDGSVLEDGLAGNHPEAYDALYEDALDIDYTALARAQELAISRLRAGEVRVTTPAGTDLRFRTGDRPFNRQDGNASPERMRSARIPIDREIELPAGVIRVAPIESSVQGRMAIPQARLGAETVRGIKLEIRNGRIVRFSATENENALKTVLKNDAARRFREFGLGSNPKLIRIEGTPELPYYGYGAGVVRLSLGDNSELGGSARGEFVRWFFFADATVEVAGDQLVRNGRLLLR